MCNALYALYCTPPVLPLPLALVLTISTAGVFCLHSPNICSDPEPQFSVSVSCDTSFCCLPQDPMTPKARCHREGVGWRPSPTPSCLPASIRTSATFLESAASPSLLPVLPLPLALVLTTSPSLLPLTAPPSSIVPPSVLSLPSTTAPLTTMCGHVRSRSRDVGTATGSVGSLVGHIDSQWALGGCQCPRRWGPRARWVLPRCVGLCTAFGGILGLRVKPRLDFGFCLGLA